MSEYRRRIGDVCADGNHFSPDVEGGGCGSSVYATVSIIIEPHRVTRYIPPIDDIVEEVNMALAYFAEHGRPGWEPKND